MKSIGLAPCLVIASVLLSACGSHDSGDPGDGGQGQPNSTSTALLQAEFPRLPDSLRDVIQARLQYVDTIRVDPEMDLGVSPDQIRSQLTQSQELVLRAVDSSKQLSDQLPLEPEHTDADVSANRHLDSVQSRLLVCGRDLLLGDAIRCWESKQFDDCAQRYAASLRIASFMLQQHDQMSKLRGQQVLTSAVLELNGRLEDGLGTKVSSTSRGELDGLIRSVKLERLPHPVPGSKFDQAFQTCRAVLTKASTARKGRGMPRMAKANARLRSRNQ